jgi:hypothetical protein
LGDGQIIGNLEVSNLNTSGIVTALGVDADLYVYESDDDDVNYNIPFLYTSGGGDAYRPLQVDNGGLFYNPATNTLTASSYNGSGENLTGIVTSITAGSGISVNQSSGSVTISSTLGGSLPTTGIGTFSAIVGVATDIDTFTISSTDYKTLEYTLHVGFGTYIQAQKVLLMQNGTNAYVQEYAIMGEPDIVVGVAATVSGGVCKLQLVPEIGVTGDVTYRYYRIGLL